MAAQQIRYAELTVTPYIVGPRGPAGSRRSWRPSRTPGWPRSATSGVELRWIFDIPADFGLPAAEMTAAAALDHDVPGLVGFGVGGSEQGFPRSMFADQFDRARAAGLHSVPHAGETTGPATIWDALETLQRRADRARHRRGRTTSDLLAHLAEHGIALDVCPTSNVALRVVPDLDAAPDPRAGGGRGDGDASTPTTRRCSAPT